MAMDRWLQSFVITSSCSTGHYNKLFVAQVMEMEEMRGILSMSGVLELMRAFSSPSCTLATRGTWKDAVHIQSRR